MRELETEYEGKVAFRVENVNTEAGQAALERHAWGDKRHGLVVLDAAGEPVDHLPGHDYGKDEIRAKVEAVLAQ